ncbi:MAG: hypothetical protein JNM45_08190 [Rhizobiales bacterium]|nr:hypothetical protein [Hyphomicrobiales bacterium]
MTSKLVIAALAALALTGLADVAEAKKPMRHGFSDPFCMGIGRHCRDSFGDNRITCGEARYRVAVRGFTKVVTRNCAGSTYAFTGSKKGKRYHIKVSGRTGFMSISRI